MDYLALLITLTPFAGAVLLGLGLLFGYLDGEDREALSAGIALWSITMAALLALTLAVAGIFGLNRGTFDLGYWLQSDALKIPFNFITHGFNLRLSLLFGILTAVVARFSVDYLHREINFHRFYFVLALYAGAMQILVLSGNAVGTFVGWEIAGFCSFLLIAYAYDRPMPAVNAVRVFVTNRIGDAAFIVGIGLSFAFGERLDWSGINALAAQLTPGEAAGLAFCFAIAAFAKSAQLPFSPWLFRAVEGPTPSTAIFYGSVMVHSGVFLVYTLQPLFERSSFAMGLLAVIGLATALHAFFLGLTQTDVKSSLIAATTVQLGLMFFECGLGFWQLAAWHMCANIVVRCYQFLSAPSLMHAMQGNPITPVGSALAKNCRIFTVSLQRFWLDSLVDILLVKPIGRLAHDLRYFDDYFVDRFIGSPAPAVRAVSSLAQYEEAKIGARLDNTSDTFSQGSGLAGKLAQWTSAFSHRIEEGVILRKNNSNAKLARRLGLSLKQFEEYILRPRYLVLFVFITLLMAF